MSNYHLRDKRLSLKAKGLLSQMLSLPEDWDYTLAGLCYINRRARMPSAPQSASWSRPVTYAAVKPSTAVASYAGNEYTIYERSQEPPSGRTVIGKTVVGKSDNGKTDAGKSHTTKYRETKYRSIKYRFDSFSGDRRTSPRKRSEPKEVRQSRWRNTGI